MRGFIRRLRPMPTAVQGFRFKTVVRGHRGATFGLL